MSAFKTLMAFLFGGAIVGEVLATLIGRSAIPWYYTPGHGQIVQSQFPETAQAIIADVVRFQLIGAALGAVAFLVIGILVSRAGARRAAVEKASPPVTR